MNIIGDRIKTLRTKKKLSQKALARLAGISASHIQHIESGYIVSPRFDTLSKIADALKVQREKFFAKVVAG
jgi:transcriptional regulator with XRE-family HTH domain